MKRNTLLSILLFSLFSTQLFANDILGTTFSSKTRLINKLVELEDWGKDSLIFTAQSHLLTVYSIENCGRAFCKQYLIDQSKDILKVIGIFPSYIHFKKNKNTKYPEIEINQKVDDEELTTHYIFDQVYKQKK